MFIIIDTILLVKNPTSFFAGVIDRIAKKIKYLSILIDIPGRLRVYRRLVWVNCPDVSKALWPLLPRVVYNKGPPPSKRRDISPTSEDALDSSTRRSLCTH